MGLERWAELVAKRGERSRGLIIEDQHGPLNVDWTGSLRVWNPRINSEPFDGFDVVMIDGLEPHELYGGPFNRDDGAPKPTIAQRLLKAASSGLRNHALILVSTTGKFGSLKVLTDSALPIEKLDVAKLVAPTELVYLLQSYCEHQDVTDAEFGALYLTPIERKIAVAMKLRGIAFEPQVSVARFTADFLIDHKLIVECDGAPWHDPERDMARDHELARHGYQTLRFTGREIHANVGQCIDRIVETLNSTPVKRRQISTNLTEAQHKVVNHAGGPSLVVAPAGSGKTMSVMARITELIESGVPSNRICALSFSNAAVNEMARRDDPHSDVTFKTIHRFGNEICRQKFGIRTIVDSDRPQPGIPTFRKLVQDSFGLKFASSSLLAAVTTYRQSLVVPNLGEVAEYATRVKKESDWAALRDEFTRNCARYDSVLKTRNLTDFAGMIRDAVEILAADPVTRLEWSSKFDHWIFDEFQDIAWSQMMLLRLLVAPARNLMAVGDDDQIIYEFTGSHPDFFTILDNDWGDMTPLPLDVNFRCPHELVVRSSWLINRNKTRIPKVILPAQQLIAEPRVTTHSELSHHLQITRTDDYSKTVRDIVERELKNGRHFRDIVVLFRSRIMAAPVEVELKAAGIPYQPLVRGSLLWNSKVKIMRSWLRVVAGVGDVDDVRTTLFTPPRYLSAGMLNSLLDASSGPLTQRQIEERIALVIRDPKHVILPENGRQTITMVQDSLRQWKSTVEQNRRYQSPTAILAALGLEPFLTAKKDIKLSDGSGEVMRPGQGAGLEIDPAVVYKVFESLAAKFQTIGDLEEWLAEMERDPQAVYEAREEELLPDGSPRLLLSTIHQAKGKEWPVVIVAGTRESGFPDFRSDLESERRLAYVAATRAKKRLYFLGSKTFEVELSENEAGKKWDQYRQEALSPASTNIKETGAPVSPTEAEKTVMRQQIYGGKPVAINQVTQDRGSSLTRALRKIWNAFFG